MVNKLYQQLLLSKATAAGFLKKKGFSDDLEVCAKRLAFAEDGITWEKETVLNICFSDEVWATRGAHTVSWVTTKVDGSDRFLPENLRHKYSKLPSWMFHRTIYQGRKGPAVF